MNTFRVSNSLAPVHDPCSVGSGLAIIWVNTICKGYHQTTKLAAIKEKVTSNLISSMKIRIPACFGQMNQL